jgi:hypothetical protein
MVKRFEDINRDTEIFEHPKIRSIRLIFGFLIVIIVIVILFIIIPYRPIIVAISPQGIPNNDTIPLYITSESPRFIVYTDTIVRESEKIQHVKKFQAQVGTFEAAVFDKNGNETTISPLIESNGSDPSQFFITLPHTRMLVSGLLQLKITLSSKGKSYDITKNFRWGGLALNFNQSSYALGEAVQMNIGVIDDSGKAICNTAMSVEVESPDHQNSIYSTNDRSIVRSDTCETNQSTDQPDYTLAHIPKINGQHRVRITLESSESTRILESTFLVTRNAGFIVDYQNAATRIIPNTTHTLQFDVRLNRPIIGEIQYAVPIGFNVKNINLEGKVVQTDASTKTIVWPIKAVAGQVIPFSFNYYTENKNPEFYLTGPLRIIKLEISEAVTRTELRNDDFDFVAPLAWEIMAGPENYQ